MTHCYFELDTFNIMFRRQPFSIFGQPYDPISHDYLGIYLWGYFKNAVGDFAADFS